MMPTVTAQRVDFAARALATPGKERARALVVAAAQVLGSRSILDLWGGGQSAAAFREACPDAAVITAERDSRLWAAMMMDAQEHRFGYHLGDVTTAPGRYDFIWLDLQGQASHDLKRTVVACRPKLNHDGALALTLMPARETEALLTQEERLSWLPVWLEEITGLTVGVFYPYRRSRGLWMWLFILLTGDWKTWWTQDALDLVRADLAEEGYWIRPFPVFHKLRDILEAARQVPA